jgi:hypothetical protein
MSAVWTTEEEAAALERRFANVNQAEFARTHRVPGGPSMVTQHIKANRPIGLEAALAYAKGFKCGLSDISPRLAAEIAAAVPLLGSKAADPVHDALADWRLQASPRALQVIDQLTTAAQGRQLDDEAWQLIGLMARRLAANAPHLGQGAPEAPARVKPEYQAELDQAVRSAEERRDHEQEQPKPRQRRTVSGQ